MRREAHVRPGIAHLYSNGECAESIRPEDRRLSKMRSAALHQDRSKAASCIRLKYPNLRLSYLNQLADVRLNVAGVFEEQLIFAIPRGFQFGSNRFESGKPARNHSFYPDCSTRTKNNGSPQGPGGFPGPTLNPHAVDTA